jgi:serine/threonine-protein phosphatase 2A activator
MVCPTKRIITAEDIEKFNVSETRESIVGFIGDLNEAIIGCANDAECDVDSVIQCLLELLQTTEQMVDGHPAADQTSSRFGKPEFRDFYDDFQGQAQLLITRLIKLSPLVDDKSIGGMTAEVATYLVESFGDRNRIDYGSGHELNFMAFLLCLTKLEIITRQHYRALVLKVFILYIRVMRKIQTMYWLEPAGSHGVWGLDDYHFLPFLFGSAQLVTHKHLRPISIHDNDLVDMFHEKYLYFGCIKFINTVKTASLRWHSPLIDDISGVKKWSKVNEGMIKMYKAEVLGKLPIMQHFMFGSLLVAPEGVSPEQSNNDYVHVHNTWADCCGIKVPSAIAANEMEHVGGLRRVPFD